MMRLQWEANAWQDYCFWEGQDRKTLRRINALINDIQRNPFSGIGKPEPLSRNLAGWWSRRIDDKNRIVYHVTGDVILIEACRGHYD